MNLHIFAINGKWKQISFLQPAIEISSVLMFVSSSFGGIVRKSWEDFFKLANFCNFEAIWRYSN